MSATRMWALWYQLPEAQRVVLTRQHGGEFNAAWQLYGWLV